MAASAASIAVIWRVEIDNTVWCFLDSVWREARVADDEPELRHERRKRLVALRIELMTKRHGRIEDGLRRNAPLDGFQLVCEVVPPAVTAHRCEIIVGELLPRCGESERLLRIQQIGL